MDATLQPHLIDLDFCLDTLGRPAWKVGPDLGSLSNREIRNRLNMAYSRFLSCGYKARSCQKAWIRQFRSFRSTPRRCLLAIPFEVPPGSSEGLKSGRDQFLNVSRLLGWDAEQEVQRRTIHREGLVLDFWYVVRPRKLDALRILLNARKSAKAYATLSNGATYKTIREDTKSIIKHISSLVKLLTRMEDGWFELVQQQDGRYWGEFDTSIEKQILERIDSVGTTPPPVGRSKDQWVRDLSELSSKSFYALVNLNERSWEARGRLSEKILGSADLFLVSKALLLLEKFKPIQTGLHEVKIVAEVSDALKVLSLGKEGPKGYKGIPEGQPIEWPTHHIQAARAWREDLQRVLDLISEIEERDLNKDTNPSDRAFLPLARWQLQEHLRELLHGPGHTVRPRITDLESFEAN